MSWEDDDFEFAPPTKVKQVGFESEEEDEDNIKESWDADSDDEKEKKKAAEAALKAKPAAASQKKGKKLKEMLKKKEKNAPAPVLNLDPLSEKLRRQKLVEEADLEVAKETFGAQEKPIDNEDLIDVMGMDPKSRADFSLMSSAIGARLADYSILKEVCMPMNSEETKKLASVLNVLSHDKTRSKRGNKGATKKAAAPVVKRGVKGANQYDAFNMGDDAAPVVETKAETYDEIDDFM